MSKLNKEIVEQVRKNKMAVIVDKKSGQKRVVYGPVGTDCQNRFDVVK